MMVEETGELWHSPAGSGDWRRVAVDHDVIAPGMREGSWSRGFTASPGRSLLRSAKPQDR